MDSTFFARFFSLVIGAMLVLGCDTLVPTSYRGEPRMSLSVGVVNRKASGEGIVPALAHVSDTKVRFRDVEFSSEFGARFRIDLHDAPGEERLAPVDAFFAPDVLVAREYIGAVLTARLAKPLELKPKVVPIHRDCWNGGCDFMLGQTTAFGLCAPDDEECRRRRRPCRDGVCQLVASAAILPEDAQDVAGFASDYLLLYLPEPVVARSWAALRLGASDGLDPGYHLAKVMTASAEAELAAEDCRENAQREVLERFNAEHAVAYDARTLSCVRGTGIFCEGVQVPNAAAVTELASAMAAAEVERGCLELAPDLMVVQGSAEEQIWIGIGQGPPEWLPSLPLALAPFVGEDADTSCLGPITDPVAGTVNKPSPSFRLISYAGPLCQEGVLELVESGGAFTILGDFEPASHRCEVHVGVTAPAGMRFRKPIISLEVHSAREDSAVPDTTVTMTYAMSDSSWSSRNSTSSQHVFGPDTGDSDASENRILVDTPELTQPDCRDTCEPRELDLRVDINIIAPEGSNTLIRRLNGEFELGVEWTTCNRDFQFP